ncbi:uncharacterized protein LOC144918732 isoform X3 [Branchiostoma floridae x Branchiostoma belcheri]
MALKIDLPPGNFAAKLNKALQMDSKGVFPPPSEKYSDEASSVADSSTIRREIRGWSAATGSTTRSSRADVRPISPTRRNNPHPSQMFMSWKVPTRLVTADYNAVNGKKQPVENDVLSEVAKVQKKSPVQFVQKKQHERTDTTHFSPPINHKLNLQSEAYERQAESAHYLSKTYPPPKKDKAWESTLPKIENGTKPQLIIKKKEKKYKAPIQSISETLNPRTRSAAKRWLEKATEEDKLVVERVLMEAEKARNSKVLDRTLQPGAKSAVEKWMKGASEGEKLVAMEFFKSLAGQKLMGGPAGMATDPSDRHAKRSRLEAVLKTLESSKGKTGIAIKLGRSNNKKGSYLISPACQQK